MAILYNSLDGIIKIFDEEIVNNVRSVGDANSIHSPEYMRKKGLEPVVPATLSVFIAKEFADKLSCGVPLRMISVKYGGVLFPNREYKVKARVNVLDEDSIEVPVFIKDEKGKDAFLEGARFYYSKEPINFKLRNCDYEDEVLLDDIYGFKDSISSDRRIEDLVVDYAIGKSSNVIINFLSMSDSEYAQEINDLLKEGFLPVYKEHNLILSAVENFDDFGKWISSNDFLDKPLKYYLNVEKEVNEKDKGNNNKANYVFRIYASLPESDNILFENRAKLGFMKGKVLEKILEKSLKNS